MSTTPSIASNAVPIGYASISEGAVSNPGITYNQAGVKYDDPYTYGGLYGFSDVEPIFAQAGAVVPTMGNVNYADIYTNIIPPTVTGLPLGPGFFMFIQNK